MKILQISTYDVNGGAARAAYRLHRGLCGIGQDCRMVVKNKRSQDDSVLLADAEEKPENPNEDFFLSAVIQPYYIDSYRTEVSNTLFLLPYPGYDLSELPVLQSADIINLHWLAQFQSPFTLHLLFSLGKPVVWTLHDHWAFTGGCHYSAGCEKYRTDCTECRQLGDDPFNLPAAILKDKLEFFKDADLTVVTPSRWMADCARQSRLFNDLRIEVIPNSLETDIYVPSSKPEAKKEIGILPESITLLFGAIDGSEKRKGFLELTSAIQFCREKPAFQKLLQDDRIRLICFGRPSEELESIGVPFVALGHLSSDEEIRTAYSAADIFLLPSLEDNLPNTILESMSCGTPVVAFDVGGLPDMVTNGVTGYLVPLSDTRKMGETIIGLILNPHLRKAMGQKGRETVEKEYPLNVQAKRYSDLYRELHRGNKLSNQTAPTDVAADTAWKPAGDKGSFSVPMKTAIGPYFREIYDRVLMKALRNIPADLEIADDRQVNELKEQMEELQVHLEARLVKIHTLTVLLKEVEAVRDTREKEVEVLEADLATRLADIERLHNELRDRLADIARLTEWLKDSEKRFAELRSRFLVRAMGKLKLI